MNPAEAFWLKRSFFMKVARFLSIKEKDESNATVVTEPL